MCGKTTIAELFCLLAAGDIHMDDNHLWMKPVVPLQYFTGEISLQRDEDISTLPKCVFPPSYSTWNSYGANFVIYLSFFSGENNTYEEFTQMFTQKIRTICNGLKDAYFYDRDKTSVLQFSAVRMGERLLDYLDTIDEVMVTFIELNFYHT